VGVEVVEVDGSAGSELLDLTFAQRLTAGALDACHGTVVGAPRRLERGEAAQPVRVTLDGQVQRRVGGVQVGMPVPPIRQPGHVHRSKHRRQAPGVPGLHCAVGDPVDVDDLDP